MELLLLLAIPICVSVRAPPIFCPGRSLRNMPREREREREGESRGWVGCGGQRGQADRCVRAREREREAVVAARERTKERGTQRRAVASLLLSRRVW